MSDQRVDDRIYDTPSTNPQHPTTLPNEPYYQQPNVGNRNARRKLGIALIVTGLLLLPSAGFRFNALPGFGSTTIVDKTFTGSRLEMNVGSGDVELRPSDDAEIHVIAIQRGGARDTYAVDASQSGDTVRVTQAEKDFFSFFSDNSIRYEVKIPENLEAMIQTSSGEITTAGNSGLMTLTTTSGDVDARNTFNGITIQTASGEVKLRDAAGNIFVKTTSGDIQLNDVADSLNLQSTSGEITIRDGHNAQLTASTTSGDIQYNGDLARGDTNTIKSISGEVKVRLPNNSDLRIDTKTTSGEVDSDFPSNEDNGAATLNVETISGDINVK